MASNQRTQGLLLSQGLQNNHIYLEGLLLSASIHYIFGIKKPKFQNSIII